MSRLAYALAVLFLLSCGDDNDEVSSAEEARLAYLGLDNAVERALNLGMAGYNAAQSANIPPQTGNGDVTGTLTISGQVDHGSSDNKEMRLKTTFVMYQDRIPGAVDGGVDTASGITYDSDAAALPALDLSLRNVPNGTFTGTFTGKVHMAGKLKGDVTLALILSGKLQSGGGTAIQRVTGMTTVTGTATSDYGVYNVNVTL